MQERQNDPLVGSLVDGRYLVLSRLARGGMSTVYRATDRRLDRDVALKILYPHLAEDSSFLDRFEREAKSAARLSHPHVVGVLDQGVEDSPDRSLAYLVMEYVPGKTLRDLLREKGRLTPRLALAMMDPVIEGLGAAHDVGLVHRDVKPENVLLASNGRIKIADFGLARAVSTTTNTGTLIGTVAYLSPELVTGGGADARSDIYSAGIVLFELLTGNQPYTGDVPIRVALQHANSTVPAPSTLVPGLAPDIDELVQWCTSVDPEDRPIDGNALLGELRHIRTTLTDEELDFELPGAPTGNDAAADRTGVIAPVPGGTEVIDTVAGGSPTEIISASRGPRPTEVIRADQSMTSVIPSDVRHPQTLRQSPQTEANPLPRPVQLTDKQARREFKVYQKRQAKAAQRPEKSLHTGSRTRRNASWIVLLFLLAGLAAGLGWFFGVGPGALATVPDVVNRSVEQAELLLDQNGFDARRAEEEFHDEVESGLVIRTQPAAQTEIRRYEAVELFVSKGPELFDVPDVVDRGEAAAAELLAGSNLAVGDITREFSADVEDGLVISQQPAAGEPSPRGTTVKLLVSQGPEPLDVPAVTGQSRADAVAAIEAAGLVAAVAPDGENSRDIPAGAVVGQSPSGGQLTRGETVTLTLSLGPRLVEVPNVFSQRESAAVAELEAAGFTVVVDYTFGGSVLGLVAGQDLTGEQPEGSTVTITVT
ncbi:PASTA domain-containing protein [Arthrobacter sp. H20]|uniref:Stk1 family PASTA domain-containing Ser/Thr kinase n=1 Tax=Arthrobacter sp. H20 TaxID=1267981 RepID=UPI00047A6D10|nr:PASTA domain-containing protein [Arthrobacter sp. H20]